MNIPASKLLPYLHPEVITVQIRANDGSPCGEFTIEALKALIARDFVTGVGYCRKTTVRLRYIQLTVPVDIAFRALGEIAQRVKDLFHSDANTTVVKALPNLPKHIKAHHMPRCIAWPHGGHASRAHV